MCSLKMNRLVLYLPPVLLVSVLVPGVAHISVTSLSCPPGFVVNNGSCVCGDWPDGMIVCDEESQPASIMIRYSMTYDEGIVNVGLSPRGFFRDKYYKFYYPLPGNLSKLNHHMCGPFNTQGRLCGKCEDGYAVPPLAYFTDFKCVKCNDSSSEYGWAMYIGFEFLPLTVAFLIIVVFGFSGVSGPVNAFIFYCQLTTGPGYNGFVKFESMIAAQGNRGFSDGMLLKVISSLYGLWNLEFFHYFLPKFCLIKNLTALHMIALQYVSALYPLFLVALLYLCIELHARGFRLIVWCWRPFHKYFVYFRRSVDPRASVIDAFATCTLLSYVKLLMISHDVLSYSNPYSGSGEKPGRTLFYYDASVQFLHGEHLLFAILVTIISSIFIAIPPVLLLLYPTSIFQKCLTCCRINCYALRTFADIFQGCYKNGTNGTRDYRYFAGLYFLLRIVIVLLTLLDFSTDIAISALVYLIASLSFALFQPYKKRVYNVVDSLILALLATIHILISYHFDLVFFTTHPSTTLLIFTDTLYTIPLVCVTLFMIYWLLCKIRRTRCIRTLFCFATDDETRPLRDLNDSLPDRIVNPGDYNML